MTRRVHLVVFAVLIAFGGGSLHGAGPTSAKGSVSGLVRDSAGVPQIGAQVQLLRPDLTVIASVYTDRAGRFIIPSVLPGRYAVKAMGTWFLPSLRENVRVRTNTVVNLTLNTLYEAMQWLPAEPRASNAQKDDWAWTLRSAANRPLLRWLEDGPLVVVSDESGAHPRLKARLVATGQEGTFGESGERISAAVEDTPSNSRELLARVDFAPDTDAGMESMLGFRQDLGFAGSVQSVAAVAIHPEMDAGGAEGLDEAAVRSWETIHLGDEFEAEVGSNQVLARFSSSAPDTVAAILPFASAGWRDGNSAIRYRMTTFLPGGANSEDTEAHSWLPAISARDGSLAIEHGLHQELGWLRQTNLSGVSVLVFADRIDNPALEAMGQLWGWRFRLRPQCFWIPSAVCSALPAHSSPPPEWRLPLNTGCPEAISSASATPTATPWSCLAVLLHCNPHLWRRCCASASSPPRPDVRALALRHPRGHRNPLAGQLPLAAGRYRHPGCTLCGERRRALPELEPAPAHPSQPRQFRPFLCVGGCAQPAGSGLSPVSVERWLAADLRPGPARRQRRPGLQLLEHNPWHFLIPCFEPAPALCYIFQVAAEILACLSRVQASRRTVFSGGMDA